MTAKFSENQFVKVIPSVSEVTVATISPDSTRQITKVRGRFYLHNVDSSQIRAKIISIGTAQEEVEIAVSSWINIEDIESKGTYWIGWLRFEFSKDVFIGAGQTVTLRFETGSYTYDVDNSYVGVCSSFPINAANNYSTNSYTNSPYDFELYEVS